MSSPVYSKSHLHNLAIPLPLERPSSGVLGVGRGWKDTLKDFRATFPQLVSKIALAVHLVPDVSPFTSSAEQFDTYVDDLNSSLRKSCFLALSSLAYRVECLENADPRYKKDGYLSLLPYAPNEQAIKDQFVHMIYLSQHPDLKPEETTMEAFKSLPPETKQKYEKEFSAADRVVETHLTEALKNVNTISDAISMNYMKNRDETLASMATFIRARSIALSQEGFKEFDYLERFMDQYQSSLSERLENEGTRNVGVFLSINPQKMADRVSEMRQKQSALKDVPPSVGKASL